MAVDETAPGFTISVSSLAPELRIRARKDPEALRQIIEGEDVTDRVRQLVYEDSEKELDVLRLVVDNHDLAFFDHPMWVKGNVVRFTFGYAGKVFGPRLAVVDNMQGFLELTITCVEETALANKAVPTIFENMTRDQVVQTMVAEGLFPSVEAVDVDTSGFKGEKPRDWQWAGETPMEFVRHRLAEKIGYEVYVDDKKLHFHARRFGGTPVRRFEYHYGDGDLLEFDLLEFRATDRVAEVEFRSRDPISRENTTATGSNRETERDVVGSVGTLAAGVGTSVGGRVGGPSTISGSAGAFLAGKNVVPSPGAGQVKAEADSYYRRQEEEEARATAKIIGDPDLPAKSVIEIVGISRTLSGKWYVERHVHTIDSDDGYTGRLTLVKNALESTGSSEPPELSEKAAENRKAVPVDKRNRIVRSAPTAQAPAGTLFQAGWKEAPR